MPVDEVTAHTWAGAVAEEAENYIAQLEMPVHLVGTGDLALMKLAKVNPVTLELDEKNGQVRVMHATKCGLLLGTAIIRSSEDTSEVTCEACKA